MNNYLPCDHVSMVVGGRAQMIHVEVADESVPWCGDELEARRLRLLS